MNRNIVGLVLVTALAASVAGCGKAPNASPKPTGKRALAAAGFQRVDRPVPGRYIVVLHSHAEARMAGFRHIEGWYNPHRRHSALDYQSPVNFEKRHLAAA